MNTQTQNNINRLHPAVRAKFLELVQALEAHFNEEFFIPSSGAHRTFQEQDALYAIGRTVQTNKSKVTNAKGGQSIHNYALAADIVPVIDGWGRDTKFYAEMGKIGKELGFVWGGNFQGLYDPTHFEYSFGKSWRDLLPIYQSGKLDAQGYVIIEGVMPVTQINTQTNPSVPPPKKKVIKRR